MAERIKVIGEDIQGKGMNTMRVDILAFIRQSLSQRQTGDIDQTDMSAHILDLAISHVLFV